MDDARPEGTHALPFWPAVMLEDVDDLRAVFLSHYYVSERVDEALVGLPMLSPAYPRWVYRPRKHPIADDSAPRAKARQVREMHLAEAIAEQHRNGKASAYGSEDIERLAAALP